MRFSLTARAIFQSGALLFLCASVGCAAPAARPIAAPANADVATLISLPTPPRIDGNDKDWPATGVQTLKGPDGSATFRIAGDATNFYAFIEVQDASPLKNNAARPEENLKGGDAIALYFGGAPATEQRVLITQRNGADEVYVYRPKSERKKPYSFSSPVGEAKFDYVAPLTGVEVAQRGNAKRGEYSCEIAIPWKSLGLATMPLQIPFQLQVLFSDGGGTTNVSSAWWYGTGRPGNTVEDLPTEARLYPDTWGIAALAGVDVAANRSVAAAMPGLAIPFELPRAGRLSLSITDKTGWIVRELVVAEAFDKGAHTVSWDGRDRYGAPLPPGQYGWKALLYDGMSVKFVGSVGNSGRPAYRTDDGLGSMGGQHGVPTALAADAGGVYMASGAEEGPPALRKIDAKTGAALWKRGVGGFNAVMALAADEKMAAYISRTSSKSGGALDLVSIDPATGRDVRMGDDKKAQARVPLGIAAPKKSKDDDEDAESFDAPAIGGMAIVGGRAYFSVPGKNRIGSVDLQSGELMPDLKADAPLGIARFDANTLLVCSGKTVSKLDVNTGKMTPLISGLDSARAVALDSAGNFYVSDLGKSQQIKKFSANGQPMGSWGKAGGKPSDMPKYEPLAFYNVNALAVGPNGNVWLSEAAVTPKRFVKLTSDGKWLEDFYGPVAYNTFGPDLDDASIVYYNSGGNQGGAQVIETKVNYANYAANPNDPSAAWRIVAIHDVARGADGTSINETMRDVARTGYGHYFAFTANNGKKYLFRPSKHNRASVPMGAGLWVWQNNRWIPTAFLTRDKAKARSWRDANGDGLMQDAERFDAPVEQEYAWIDRDLKLDGGQGTLAPAAIDARGVPTYADGTFAPYFAADAEPLSGGWTFFSPENKGAVYYVANIGPHRHLGFWDRASENRVTKVQDGKIQWIIGQHAANATFTEFNTLTGVAGTIDDITLVHTVDPNYYAITSDGFNLGNVMADADGIAPRTGPTAVTIESFTGLYVRDPKTKKKLLFSVSSGDDRILEVVGPGQTTRLNGEVTLDSARPGLPASGPTVIPYATLYGTQGRGQGVDGYDYDWQPGSLGVPLYAGQTLIGDVRLRRDAGNLWVFADVTSATPQAGDGVEIQLAPREGGTPVALKFMARPAKDGEMAAQAMLDGKELTRGAKDKGDDKIEVAATPRWRGLGYRLEARVPLALLPQLSAPREQTFQEQKGKSLETQTATRPDLSGPLRLKAMVVADGKMASWPAKEWGEAIAP